MRTRTLCRSLGLATLLTAIASSALAGSVAFVFTLDWQSGPLLGSSSRGSLSFDESLVAPNAQYSGTSSGDIRPAPVPEPSSVVLLLFGMGLLAGRRRSAPHAPRERISAARLRPAGHAPP